MPHIILEYSSNIIEQDQEFSKKLFPDIHQLLVDDLGANIDACKSRSIKYDNCYLADGSRESFIFFEIKILPGRSKDRLEKLSQNLLELAKEYFSCSIKQKNLAISVNIVEMENYKKFN
jgi:5-carboxymethyl-2-hydroxymuconate isomerase